MAHAYTPGLKVSRQWRYRLRRLLPVSGEVLVGVGDTVDARQIVARTHMPGDVTPVNLARQLSIPPADVSECLLKREGDAVEKGELLARSKGMFGFFKSDFISPAGGVLESVSSVTGQLMIRGAELPIEVSAFLAGEVIEVLPGEGVVIEADVTYVQGIFGIGGEAFGPLRMVCERPDDELGPDRISEEMAGQVLVGGARMTGAAVRRAIEVGAAAVISGGMDDQDLKDILGYDLGVAITGSEQIGTTLIVTEGFGEIAMAARTFELLASRAGAEAAVNGATQIRAGVMRPEIVIPLGDEAGDDAAVEAVEAGRLEVGTTVRIIRDPNFGVIGTVSELPAELFELESGSHARVLKVDVAGTAVVVPRANVELIER